MIFTTMREWSRRLNKACDDADWSEIKRVASEMDDVVVASKLPSAPPLPILTPAPNAVRFEAVVEPCWDVYVATRHPMGDGSGFVHETLYRGGLATEDESVMIAGFVAAAGGEDIRVVVRERGRRKG